MKNKTIFSIALFISIILSPLLWIGGGISAQNIATTGVWSSTSTWSLGHVPTSGEDVLIPLGANVTVDANINIEHPNFSVSRFFKVDGNLLLNGNNISLNNLSTTNPITIICNGSIVGTGAEAISVLSSHDTHLKGSGSILNVLGLTVIINTIQLNTGNRVIIGGHIPITCGIGYVSDTLTNLTIQGNIDIKRGTNGGSSTLFTNYGKLKVNNGSISFSNTGHFTKGVFFYNYPSAEIIINTGDLVFSGDPFFGVQSAIIYNVGNIEINGKLILKKKSASSMTFHNGLYSQYYDSVTCSNTSSQFYSPGTLTVKGDILGQSLFPFPPYASSVNIRNYKNSIINVAGSFIPSGGIDNGTLYANDTNNIINYNGSGSQVIKQPFDSVYWNLRCSNSNVKTLENGIVVDGNLTIADSAQLDVSLASYNINIKGNWNDSSLVTDPFVEHNNAVTFSGDTLQTITASSIGKESFYNLTINKPTVNNELLLKNSISIANHLNLTKGGLILNSDTLFIVNPLSAAITRDSGYIKSETSPSIGYSAINWKIGNQLGNYQFPFGKSGAASDYIPVTFSITTSGDNLGSISVATYSTAVNNLPYPNTVTNNNWNNVNNSAQTVDRYWQIDAMYATTKPTATFTLTATTAEIGSNTNLQAQRWNVLANSWELPSLNQTNSTNSVAVYNINSFSPWRLANIVSFPPTLITSTIVSQTNVSCFFGRNGSATVFASGGVGTLSYLWLPTGGTAQTASNLARGTYTCMISDSVGNFKNQLVTITEPSLMFASVLTQKNVSCYGLSDGELTVTASGGTPPYSYVWTNPVATGAHVSGLSAGVNYAVQVRDNNLCLTTKVGISVTQPPEIKANAIIKKYCDIDNKGAITLSPTDGVPPYQYKWSNGAFSESISGLSLGTYTCVISDANAWCSVSSSFVINQAPLVVAGIIGNFTVCAGTTTDSLTATGGASYVWSNGNTAKSILITTQGSYSVTAISLDGCTNTVSQNIKLNPLPTIIINASATSVCLGTSVTLTGSGASSYVWSGGIVNGVSFAPLRPKTYTVIGTDANGCSNASTIRVEVGCLPTLSSVELWGMTSSGGQYGKGIIFQYNSVDSVQIVRHSFSSLINGSYPSSSLIQASDGMFYGVTSGGINNGAVLFEYDPTTFTYTKKHDFESGTIIGGSLTQSSNGMLYGVANFYNGTYNYTTSFVFQYNPITSVYSKRVDLNASTEGYYSLASLIQANDGMLYGMNVFGGLGGGVLFQYNPITNQVTKKFDFSQYTNGAFPYGSLVQTPDGKLYGLTSRGGIYENGTLFQFDPITNLFTKKLDFNLSLTGANPYGSLVYAADGMLYGMTANGGVNNGGIIFQFNPITSTFVKKFDFNEASGMNPKGSFLQASDGKLYALTTFGGVNNRGVVFQYDPITSSYSKKLDFNETNGALPNFANLIEYVAETNPIAHSINTGTIIANNCAGEDIIIPYSVSRRYSSGNVFTAQLSDSTGSFAAPVTIGNVNTYNSDTIYGVIPKNYPFSNGYRVRVVSSSPAVIGTDNGTNITINASPNVIANTSATAVCLGSSVILTGSGASSYAWSGSVVDGVSFAPLTSRVYTVIGTGANGCTNSDSILVEVGCIPTLELWGMTAAGGADDMGVIFKTDGYGNNLSVEYSFLVTNPNAQVCANGKMPQGSLIKAFNGKFYGMTSQGGVLENGVVFEYNPNTGEFIKVVDFNQSNGRYPIGSLLQASDSMLYGMTYEGGQYGFGNIFQYNVLTNTLTNIFSFDGSNSGAYPEGSLIQASNGMLYGVTNKGGVNNLGVLFQFDITTSTVTKKIDFNGTSNGKWPRGSLLQANDGMLYGTTEIGGLNNNGVLFQYNISTSVLTKKIDFKTLQTGKYPNGNLIQATDGMLYGITNSGGSPFGIGTLFQYNTVTSTLVKKVDFSSSNGYNPFGSLIQASNGMLYGMCQYGGVNNNGVLFQYDPLSSTYSKKIDFIGANGSTPVYTNLMEYANTGGVVNSISTGTISVNKCEGDSIIIKYSVLKRFNSNNVFIAQLSDSLGSFASPVNIGNVSATGSGFISAIVPSNYQYGNGYRVRVVGSSPVVIGTDNGSNITINALPIVIANTSATSVCLGSSVTLTGSGALSYAWSGGIVDGVSFAPLTSKVYNVIGTDSNGCSNSDNIFVVVGCLPTTVGPQLWGMTTNGGEYGGGVIFQYDAANDIQYVKYNFSNDSLGGQGAFPMGSLLQASNGMLYGTAAGGGTNGNGVLFEYNPTSLTYTKKHDFESGSYTGSSLIEASDGMLYGNAGTYIYQYNPVSSSFTKKVDIDFSNGGLMQAFDGKIYGMSLYGGANYRGALFQYDPLTNILSNKVNFSDSLGSNPSGALVQTPDGKLFGLTPSGGANFNGVLFEYDPNTNIYSKKIDFDGFSGSYPQGSLIYALDDMLYGLAQGGQYYTGVLFQYNPLTSSFVKKIDLSDSSGMYPYGLIQASDGRLYGMAQNGGANYQGTIFRYDIPSSTLVKKLDFNGINGQNPYRNNLIEYVNKNTIHTSPISVNNCAGDSIVVQYSVTGNFNSGNAFIAQLSDSLGSFTTPINIGNASTTASGSISGFIPTSIKQGNRYRVRVVSSNPIAIGNDNGVNLTINSLPQVALITTDSSLCSGDTVTLYVIGNALTYNWIGGNNNVYSTYLDSTATFVVEGIGGNGCSNTGSLTVFVRPLISDINLDGFVNVTDFLLYVNKFGVVSCGCPEDINKDDIVNIVDFSILLNEYGLYCR